MNNNRGNNRRRGRGSNNRQNGGGQQLNRIDSRARGNAPQLLEKYRKLAHDAHLNGDRVNEEYFLQFADHYFRVIADTRVRQEEQRQRRDDRWQDGDTEREDGGDSAEFGGESEYAPYDQASFAPRQREDRQRDDRRRDERPRDERPREDRPQREPRQERPRREDRSPERADEQVAGDEAMAEAETANPFEPSENPFTRDNRTRGLKPRREPARPRRSREDAEGEASPVGLDPATLPPAISVVREEQASEVAGQANGADASGDADAKPRRRTRKAKPPVDDAGEALEAVN